MTLTPETHERRKLTRIGHRGAKGYAPENTLVSFQKALDLGVDGIELDVHLSAEGVLVVIHDQSLNRTTNGVGLVANLNLSQLRSFLIEERYEIPTLEEVLDLIDKKAFVNIELKGPGTALPAVALIERFITEKEWCYHHFVVSSFDWNALLEVRNANANIALAVLTETDWELAFGFAQFIKASNLHPYFHLLTAENTKKMQEKGLIVYPWTVNEPVDILKIKSLGVDGIISDYPDRI